MQTKTLVTLLLVGWLSTCSGQSFVSLELDNNGKHIYANPTYIHLPDRVVRATLVYPTTNLKSAYSYYWITEKYKYYFTEYDGQMYFVKQYRKTKVTLVYYFINDCKFKFLE